MLDEAEAGLREVLATIDRVHGEDSAAAVKTLVELADVLGRRGRWEEAVGISSRAVALCTRHYPRDHAVTPSAMAAHGVNLMNAGRPREAESQFRGAVGLAPGCDPPATAAAPGEPGLGEVPARAWPIG